MLYIHGRKIITTAIVLVVLISTGYGQRIQGGQYFQKFNTKPYYFGLALGYVNSNFKIKHADEFIRNDSFLLAEGVNGPGFQVNLIGNLKFGQYIDFRFLPGFTFTDRTIEYVSKTDGQTLERERIESNFIEVPFQFRYKSQPYKNKRLFITGGIRYTFDASNNSRTRQASTLIKLAPHDFAVEVGAGVQIFFPFFIFSPEIRFSHGINNIHIENPELERANVIEKLISRSLTITLNFEG